MRPNKIMSVACVPPSCVNKASAEMGAVLLDVIIKETDPRSQDVWVPSDNFLETTSSSASSLYRWRNWGRRGGTVDVKSGIHLLYWHVNTASSVPEVLSRTGQSPKRSLLWPVGRPLAGSLRPSCSGGSHRQVDLTRIAICGYFLPLLLYKPRTLSGHLQTFSQHFSNHVSPFGYSCTFLLANWGGGNISACGVSWCSQEYCVVFGTSRHAESHGAAGDIGWSLAYLSMQILTVHGGC